MKIPVITVRDAAAIMGLQTDTVEAGLIQGRFPWGYAIQTGKDRWRYWINAKKFYEIEQVKEEANG